MTVPLPLVSVTIPAYNAAAFLSGAIDLALAQDYPAMEVLIGDDGSTDDTPQILERYGPRIRIVRHPGGVNRGLGATRNLLVRAARGEFIALLDADDLWLPGKISTQVQAMLAQPQAGMCHTAYEKFGDPADSGPMLNDPDFVYEGWCFDKIFQFNNPCVATVLLRRSALPDHLFYEDLRGYEDYALWLEVMFTAPTIYLPRITARYRRHVEQMTAGDRGRRMMAYRGLARLRFLEHYGDRLSAADRQRWRDLAVSELKKNAYSRYWQGDFAMARFGFGILAQYGHRVPWRHRLRAAVGSWMK
jgi:glycosyltransferase involved in cell wall biosynthesis